MRLKETIEYYKLDGKVFLGDNLTDDALILDVTVEFEAQPTWDNDGIGTYEFWGYKEYDNGKDYVTLEESPSWDESLHTPDENYAIRLFVQSADFDRLCDKFCKEYEKKSGY